MKRTTTSYNFFKYFLGFIFKILYRPKIYNKELIPESGALIFSGNHYHLFDQNLVIISTKRMVRYLAKIEYFNDKRKAWFFKMAGCIPVNREIKDENASNQALKVLKNDLAIGIFPEGTRNKTDKFLLPFKFGVVSLAQKTGAKIMPFAVTGDYKIFQKSNLNIRYGKPFKVPKDMDLKKANEKLFKIISDLKKEGLKNTNQN